ncbi:hypothetical protein [Alteromonas sp. a30]|nr:hypothetical protein [Alteromonas sp. a30]
MVEPIAVFSLLITPCLAYSVGALVFWVVGVIRRQSEPNFKSG